MKSIEALHDEALSLVPATASDRNVSEPPTISHAATPSQESQLEGLKGTSESVPPRSVGEPDIMARIDHLLEKLNVSDDITIAPVKEKGTESNTGNMTEDSGHAATPNSTATNRLANPNSDVLSDEPNQTNENTTPSTAVDGRTADAAEKQSTKTGDDARDDVSANDQSEEAASHDQTQALADIADAIYQARQQAVDKNVLDTSQNSLAPVDMDALLATVADEVRRTVTAVMVTELPKIIRKAVDEAIRALPTDTSGQSTPINGNQSTASKVEARKAAARNKAVSKKTVTKKVSTKKPTAKKATGTATANKKLSTKKGRAKKATAKKIAQST